jgi:hypothetical protein
MGNNWGQGTRGTVVSCNENFGQCTSAMYCRAKEKKRLYMVYSTQSSLLALVPDFDVQMLATVVLGMVPQIQDQSDFTQF